MLTAYSCINDELIPETRTTDLSNVLWVDLYNPTADEVDRVEALAVTLPTRDEMNEIEVSNRLFSKGGADYRTVMMVGQSEAGLTVNAPLTIICTPAQIFTIRYHTPKFFSDFPAVAALLPSGCSTPETLFLGLMDEGVALIADILERIGKKLDPITHEVFVKERPQDRDFLRSALREIGRAGDEIAQINLDLLTLERALTHFSQSLATRRDPDTFDQYVRMHVHDIRALTEHAGSLEQRVGFAASATLGMINLQQASATQILSVVAALFLPPTLITSFFGMNFSDMNVLEADWGYKFSILTMIVSVVATMLFFKWRRWF